MYSQNHILFERTASVMLVLHYGLFCGFNDAMLLSFIKSAYSVSVRVSPNSV